MYHCLHFAFHLIIIVSCAWYCIVYCLVFNLDRKGSYRFVIIQSNVLMFGMSSPLLETSRKHVRVMGYVRVNLFFHIFAPKHRLWALDRTASARRFCGSNFYLQPMF